MMNALYQENESGKAGRAQIPDMARFRGNRIGLFTCNDEKESGYVEFRDVIYNAVI